ncbi:hypothetical protein Hanom_Chr06g00533001 [Helianthus anomalus]
MLLTLVQCALSAILKTRLTSIRFCHMVISTLKSLNSDILLEFLNPKRTMCKGKQTRVTTNGV